MSHLDDGLRTTLLQDTRERYKFEHDRFNQAFSRAGVYLAVAGVIATALYRFIDKPPAHGTYLYAGYFLCLMATILATCIGVTFVILSIIGRSMNHGVRPNWWLAHATDTQNKLAEQASPAAQGSVPGFVRIVIEEQIVRALADAADDNIRENQKRFWMLFRASVALSSALFFLIATGVLYAAQVYRNDDETKPSVVRVSGPVRVIISGQGGSD